MLCIYTEPNVMERYGNPLDNEITIDSYRPIRSGYIMSEPIRNKSKDGEPIYIEPRQSEHYEFRGLKIGKLYYHPIVYIKASDLDPAYLITVEYINRLKDRFPDCDRIPAIKELYFQKNKKTE